MRHHCRILHCSVAHPWRIIVFDCGMRGLSMASGTDGFRTSSLHQWISLIVADDGAFRFCLSDNWLGEKPHA